MSQENIQKLEKLRVHADNLRRDPSATARVAMTEGIAQEFADGGLNSQENALAIEILEIAARDLEQQVREALAEHVKHCPFLPPTIARRLAADVEAVAEPILRFSQALDDDDLVAIVHASGEIKQLAVAQREGLAAQVSDALVDAGSERVVGVLLANHNADIAEQTLGKVVDSHGESDRIRSLLIGRPTLPLTTSEQLITLVSGELREQLVTRHQIPPELAEELTRQGREGALTQVLSRDLPGAEVERLAANLFARNVLTPTLVLRALCVGDLAFFQAAMAVLAGIPVENVKPLIYDQGRAGLEAIYEQSRLPRELFSAFRTAVEVVMESGGDKAERPRLEMTERIVRRLSREYDSVCPEGLEHMLSQLSRLVVGQADQCARGLT